jgi:5-methylthioadenosine/S-adenosylhomocysteine deaminase
MDKLLIRNGTLLTMSDDRQPRKADLLVVGGRIKKIDTVVDRNVKPDTIIDASGMVVLPGFIFGHARLGFSILRGQVDQLTDDAERERTALRLIANLTSAQVRTSAMLGICQAVHSGITTLFDGGAMRYTEEIVEAARELGFRLFCGRMLADRTRDWPQQLRVPLREQLADTQALARAVAAVPDGLVRYAVSTTNPIMCSDNCLAQARAAADSAGCPLKIALTTDRNQVEVMHREGGTQELSRLEALGILSEHTYLVNPSFLSELEQNVVRKAGSRVVINASADLKLGRPMSRLPEFVRKGTPVLAGFDSPLYGGRLDAIRELAIVATAFRPQYGFQTMQPEQALSLLTVDAARALGIEGEVGTLEEGKQADIVIVDLGRDIFAQPSAHTNPIYRLVYEASACDVAWTIIAGRVVYGAGTVTGCDEQELLERAGTGLMHLLEES